MLDTEVLKSTAGIVLGLVVRTHSAYTLYCCDQEAKRLFELAKFWGRTIGDDAFELQKIKRGLVIGYWVFLIVSLVMTVVFVIRLVRNLDYL